jgi:anti-anti-sigma regulatory factor
LTTIVHLAMEQLEIIVAEGGNGAHIMRLEGSLTLRTISSFQIIARHESSRPLIIDLSNVPYIDSAGLGAVPGLSFRLNGSRPALLSRVRRRSGSEFCFK